MKLIAALILLVTAISIHAQSYDTFSMNPDEIALSEAQRASAREIAKLVAEPYANAAEDIPYYRKRGLEDWKFTTLNPHKEGLGEYVVTAIARKNGLNRVSVKAPIRAISSRGEIKGVATVRILMDIDADGKLVGNPAVNNFDNLLPSDNGRYFPTNPEPGPYRHQR